MQSSLKSHEIVEDCEGMYEDAYGNVAKQERDGLVLSDLQQDLVRMSNQPAIRDVYRRFVIIKSDKDVHGRPGEDDWVSSQSGGFRFQAVNLVATSSANGSRLQSSRLATKLVVSTYYPWHIRPIIHNVYDTRQKNVHREDRFSRNTGRDMSRGREPGRLGEFDLAGRCERRA